MQRTDSFLDHAISNLLRTGVLAASLVVLAGGIGYMAGSGRLEPHYDVFRSEPRELRSIGGILAGAISGQPRCVIQFGLLLLIATPVARVAFSAFVFATRRDWTFATIELLVLVVLILNLAGVVSPPH